MTYVGHLERQIYPDKVSTVVDVPGCWALEDLDAAAVPPFFFPRG